MNVTKAELKAKFDEYLATFDDTEQDEWYCTERFIHSKGLDGFIAWLYAEEDAKAARRKLYEELHKEFGAQEESSKPTLEQRIASGRYFAMQEVQP